MADLRRLISKEDGVALPVAAAMLMVISFLVIAFFSASIQLRESSTKDERSKRALSAAEAGLQAAVYRLNQIRSPSVPKTSCLTSGAAAVLGTGECPSYTEDLGNGASYTYYVTPWLGAAGTCVIKPGVTPETSDRCVTATGTVGGVSRRIQARVSEEQVFAGFLNAGLVGKDLVHAYNSITIYSDVGSNSQVTFDNSINVKQEATYGVSGNLELGAGAVYNQGNSVTVEGNGGNPMTVQAYDIPTANFEFVDGDRVGFTENQNSALPAAHYDATDKTFIVANGTVNINSSGPFYLCRFHIGNNVKLRFSHPQGATRIYVDHPSRPGSNCPNTSSSTGTFEVDNGVELNKDVGAREDLLEVYLYGTPEDGTRTPYSWCPVSTSPVLPEECRSDFMLDNSVEFYGMVFAPNSTVGAHNSVKMYGGVAAKKIRFYNSVEFHNTSEARNAPAKKPGPAVRKGWQECKAEPTVSSDPESGC